jgi:hypothetical protein
MLSCSRSHLATRVLLESLTAVVTRDRATTAEMLDLIAEVDRRGAFRDEGYSSMYRFCVEKLRMSEDVAYKRILAARASKRFPAILPAIAEGSLTISTVALLRNHLKTVQGEELLKAAIGKTRSEVELLIAARFPKPDVPTTLELLGVPASPSEGLSPQNDLLVTAETPAQVAAKTEGLPVPGRVNFAGTEPAPVAAAPQRRVAPLSPGRFELRLTISQALHDKLRRALELLGHSVPSGEIPQLLERALDELIAKQEKLKFAATDRPRVARRSTKDPRYIPADKKRAVRKRDGDRCTYLSADGHRCEERKFLEYDHEVPLARGGQTTVANLRLRCRAHNQLEAERTFGAGFMEEKRRVSRSRRLMH